MIESKEYNKKEPHNCKLKLNEYNDIGQLLSDNINIPSYFNSSHMVKYKHDINGNNSSMILPNGARTNYVNDIKTGEIIELSTTANGVKNATQFAYQNGLLTRLNNSSVRFNYEYDSKDRRTRVLLSDMEYVNMSYDDSDKQNNKVVTTYENGFVVTTTTNEKGLVKSQSSKIDGVNQILDFTYDSNDKLESLKKNNSVIETYGYDSMDRMNSRVYQKDAEEQVTWYGGYNTNDTLSIENVYFDGINVTTDYEYTGDNDDVVKKVTQGTLKLELESDSTDRTTEKVLSANSSEFLREEIVFFDNPDTTTNYIKTHNFKLKGESKLHNNYDYDNNGNISNIESEDNSIRYQYDQLGRIVREDNEKLSKSYTFKYDKSGNIIQRKEYDYSLEELLRGGRVTNYTYRNGFWKDQLLEFGNEVCTYNAMGYPLVYRDKQLDWSNNGTLKQFDNIIYSYDYNQIRNQKTVNGINTKYFLQGTKILKEKSTNHSIEFEYLIEKLVGFKYNGVRYIYQRNIQGDITHIYDAIGSLVATYVYDAWGNHKVYDSQGNINTSSSFIGNINPFRYRGYYFDIETGLYYLNSRYYDPETGRFISPDIVSILDETMLQHNGLNLYMYCGNNPVMNVDPTGYAWWKWLAGVAIVAGIAIATVATGGLASPVLIGAAFGALTGGVTSAIAQIAMTGKIEISQLFLDMSVGAIMGALGGSNISKLGMTIAGATVGFVSSIASDLISGESVKLDKAVFSAILGGTFSFMGGAGAQYGKTSARVNILSKIKIAKEKGHTSPKLMRRLSRENQILRKASIDSIYYGLYPSIFNSLISSIFTRV